MTATTTGLRARKKAQLREAIEREGLRLFATQGFDVRFCASAELPSDQRAIEPEGLHRWVTARVPDDAEAICIGGNGFRAVGMIEAIEQDLDRPVVTANQALLWSLLATVGHPPRPSRYGRLMSTPRAE